SAGVAARCGSGAAFDEWRRGRKCRRSRRGDREHAVTMTPPSASTSPELSASCRVVRERAAVREAVATARTAGKSIGLVPTMGALHAGHLSPVQAARRECGFTIVTVFV